MYVYSLGQWLLFFFLYCFLGWVWESCYVSAKRRQWVNRGFLHGPMLPIYGTGAVIILLATIPVRDSLWLVFLLGMLAATALEYVTGAAMEALFKVVTGITPSSPSTSTAISASPAPWPGAPSPSCWCGFCTRLWRIWCCGCPPSWWILWRSC